MEFLSALIATIIVGVIVIAIIVKLLSWLYVKSSGETAIVRTGFGGQKVIINSGALVIPVLHQTVPVNLNTLRLEVKRVNEHALITRDHMRVDVEAAFYVRVVHKPDTVLLAAQTLGTRTMNADALRDLVEGKFVDVLRSVAARSDMQSLHENRSDFVRDVRETIAEDLLKNGLELESVSLLDLDQTGLEFFDQQNAFDAAGLTKLTEEIERRREKRAAITKDTELAIRRKDIEVEYSQLELDKEQLDIGRQAELARLVQEQAIAEARARQKAVISQATAEQMHLSELARLSEQLKTEQEEIRAKEARERADIASRQTVEAHRIAVEQELENARILKARTLDLTRIDTAQELALAENAREIEIARSEMAKSEVRAKAEAAKIVQIKAEERSMTEQQQERKAREKLIAEFDAEMRRIAATADADAETIRAKAAEILAEVEAQARQRLHEADNVLSAEQIAYQVRMQSLERLPDIIRESVKPMERIQSIRIAEVNGLGIGAGTGGDSGGVSGGDNLSEQMVNSALRYRAQAPLVDEILEDVGLRGIFKVPPASGERE